MSIQSAQDMRVALLYQTTQHGSHLREALKELGAAVVYEGQSSNIDRDALESSGARVVIVNLDADSDEYIDQVYDVLDAGDYEIVFNDAQVSSNLSGWDHARWARNLASKILSKPEAATPPRPPGAQAVPTPVQVSASAVPVAERPGPAPAMPAAAAVVEKAAPAPVARAAAKPVAEPARGSERPTMEMPLPEEFRKSSTPEPEALDIAGLGDFAMRVETIPEGKPAEAEPPEAPAVVEQATDAGFAAELDALFAAADAAKPATSELDIGLPADFDLGDLPATPVEKNASLIEESESIELATDAGAGTPSASLEEQLHEEFPAIFDQLDVAAAAIPESGDTFKSSEKAPAEKPAKSEPLLPTDWSLEALDESAEASAAAAPKPAFGIEKMGAADYLKQEVEAGTAKQQATLPTTGSGLSLELMPMEEAVAPQTFEKPPHYQEEAWLDGSRPAQKVKPAAGAGTLKRVFVLGASIGGPEAVRDFLGALPAGFPVLFVLAQHMGEEFLELMSAQLRKSIALTVRNPTHGERVGHGEVLIVPTTHRLQVDGDGVITLAHLPEKPPYSPSIDMVLRDVADQFGDRAGTIIFSGMAHDAIEGSQYLKSKGGTVWVQDPDTCVISSMVDGAREAGIVTFMGSPAQLAEKMIAEYGKG